MAQRGIDAESALVREILVLCASRDISPTTDCMKERDVTFLTLWQGYYDSFKMESYQLFRYSRKILHLPIY